MPITRSGPKRHRIKIYAPPDPTLVANQDAYGQPNAAATLVATRWGSVEPLSSLTAAERFMAQQTVADATHAVKIRYDADLGLKPSYYLVHRDRTLQIGNISNTNERDNEFVIFCKEKVV